MEHLEIELAKNNYERVHKMKKHVFFLALITLLSFSLVFPALAAEPSLGPSITWLTGAGEPCVYNRELNWLTCKIDDDHYYVIDLQSQAVVEEYEYVCPFIDGLARVARKNSAGNMRHGYINRSMELIIPLKYEMAHNFLGGRALVWSGGKCGYIDTNGNEVVPLEWDDSGAFPSNLAYVGKRNADGVMKYGYIDKQGQLQIPLEWDTAGNFSDGLAKVGKKNAEGEQKYGYINATGEVVVPLTFDAYWSLPDFSEGMAAIQQEDSSGNIKWGYIDKAGAVVIPPKYASATVFSKGMAAVQQEDFNGALKWGVIDKTGREIIPFSLDYDEMFRFFDSPWGRLAAVLKTIDHTTYLGLVDAAGEEVMPISEWLNILALANEWGFGLKNGADNHNEWYCIDKTGAIISPTVYDGVGVIEEGIVKDNVSTQGEGGMYWVKKGDSYGYFEVTKQMQKPIDSSVPKPEQPESAGFSVTVALAGAAAIAGAAAVTLILLRKKCRLK